MSSSTSTFPTPPMETYSAPIKPVSSDIIQSQIDAMSRAGLDHARFERFLSANEYLEFPHGVLAAFFEELLERIPIREEIDASYFEQLAIRHDIAANLAEEYLEFQELGWLPERYLVFYFGAVAEHVEEVNLSETVFKRLERNDPDVVLKMCYDKLLNAMVGETISVDVQGQRENIDDEPNLISKKLTRCGMLPEGLEYFYHSTSKLNAASIIVSGPLVGSASSSPNDFNGAFYGNVQSEAALKLAKRSAVRCKMETIVLVFKVQMPVRNQWSELKLVKDKLWSRIVTAFRTKKYSKIDLIGMMLKYDVITGPILANPRQVAMGLEETKALDDYEQIAIISHRLGVQMREYITGYMIVSPNQQ